MGDTHNSQRGFLVNQAIAGPLSLAVTSFIQSITNEESRRQRLICAEYFEGVDLPHAAHSMRAHRIQSRSLPHGSAFGRTWPSSSRPVSIFWREFLPPPL